jgi:hypothetical protein
MVDHIRKNIPQKIVEKEPDDLLKSFSGEFIEDSLERSFLNDTWMDYKKAPQNTFLIGGLIIMSFTGVDWLTQNEKSQLLQLIALRGIAGLFCLSSFLYLRKTKAYFNGFHLLSLVNQLLIASVLILVGIIAKLPFIHNAFHVFIGTLVFYQFVHNRFSYTLIACAFYPTVYLAVSWGMYPLGVQDLVRFILYLTLANALGIMMLSHLNRSWRKEYIQYLKEQYLNQELRNTVDQLLKTQQEVKVLQGLIPICSHCKKIRDDKGVWNQLEFYIQDHSEATFSHGICPKCAEQLYPDYKLDDD